MSAAAPDSITAERTYADSIHKVADVIDLEKGLKVGVQGDGDDDIEVIEDETIPTTPTRTQTQIQWHEHTATAAKHINSAFKRTNSLISFKRTDTNTTNGSKQPIVRPYGRGGAGRKQTYMGPQILSDSEENARAEAASWAQLCPLMAATFGPLSVLLGIPTLTQRWHGLLQDPTTGVNGASNFIELPDPTLNLILAGVALACEVAGNILLILRFSNWHAKAATWISYGFWIAKLIIQIVNYIQFGITHPETTDIIYLQGFWVFLVLLDSPRSESAVWV
jgi:hypothetical protein